MDERLLICTSVVLALPTARGHRGRPWPPRGRDREAWLAQAPWPKCDRCGRGARSSGGARHCNGWEGSA
eukprot:9469311-Pyramimonas_sp.AAC.1